MARGKLDIKDVRHLASRLGVPAGELTRLAAETGRFVDQQERAIKGKSRRITVPRRRLKLVQRAIADRLLLSLALPECAHGYRKGRSVATAASAHLGESHLLAMDIKGFFPSIGPQMVYAVWIQLGCSPDVAHLLTRLTTFDRQLPLGFPSSPAIANLVRGRLDARIQGLCDKQPEANYTCYSDNLYVSGPYISARLAESFTRIAADQNLPIPADHVVLSGPRRPKRILGLTVSRCLRVPKEYRRRVRAAIHQYRSAAPHASAETLRSIEGKIRYVERMDPVQGARLWAYLSHPSPPGAQSAHD